ncbi:sensor histidine kinase [Glycomyces xiaoerkulensis]|uniref:sensor histidine kinase n=1 Tax=Glycomyces xiaoerkulensis TaxID=2038139 RepID=UPI000C25FEFE|nr:sensor histidine kinase [Glycomyces xiaoerkulensis]
MLDRFSDRVGDLIVGLATAFVILVWTGIDAALREQDPHGLSEPIAWAAVVVACAALFFRSSYPLAVAIVAWTCALVYYPASAIDGPMLLAFVIALYSLAAHGRTVAASIIGALTFVLSFVSEILSDFQHLTEAELLLLSGWYIAIVAIGTVVAHYRRYRAEMETALAEGRRRSAAEERLRIARELHDAVGHHLSLINVQSVAALRKLKRNPDHDTGETLQVVADTSRLSLRELRSLVAVLREAGEDSPTDPGPSLDHLPALVAAAEAAGLEVELREDGRAELPAAVDAAAFRVIQEALTNVVRHAEASRVQVGVVCGASTLAVRVADDGRAKSGKALPGNGLAGMRERAEGLGGTFDAGPAEDGGFVVEATWPMEVQS